MRLSLNKKSVDILRALAQKLPLVYDDIENDTQTLLTTFNSIADGMGYHEKDFQLLLLHIKKSQLLSTEAILALSPRLNSVADRIEDYLKKQNSQNHSISSNNQSTSIVPPIITGNNTNTSTQTTHRALVSSYNEAINTIKDDIRNGSGKEITDADAVNMFNAIQSFSGEKYDDIRMAYDNPYAKSEDKLAMDYLDSYIRNAPKWDGEIYRGINVSKKTAKSILSKSTVDMLGPSSWSSNLNTAQKFAYIDGSKGSVNMVFILPKNKSGASITHLATYNGIEDEVSAPSGIYYCIDNYETVYENGRKFVYVYVHE